MQDFCKHQNEENGACRTSANVKMEETELAGLLQTSKWKKRSLQNFCKRQNGGNGACRTSANVKMGKMELAGLLQTSKWKKRSLQSFCKRQNGGNGICRTSANATEIRLAFAGMLQTPRKYGWHLQECCKRHRNTVGICRNAANATEIRLVFAGMLQTSKKRNWDLRNFRKRQNGENSLRSILYDSKEKRRERRMNALEINAELQHELSVIADDEGYLKRALKSIRRLADQKRKEDETYMTDEEFQAKINRSLEQARRGEVIELLPGESLDDMLRRAGYDI